MIATEKKLSGNGHHPSGQTMQTNVELLPLIMNNIPQAVFWKDRNLVYVGCNQAFAEDAGLSSPSEVIGKTDFDMPWKEQATLYQADDRLVMESGVAKLNYEEPQTTPDGSRTWLLTNKIPVRENGEIVAVLGMYEDITGRKQAEVLLQQSETTLSAMLRVAQMGHWEFDLRTQTFTFNDQYYSLHGRTAQEVGGYQMSVQRFAQEFVHPEDGPIVGQATQQAIESTDPNFQTRTEARILHADGKPRWVSVWFRVEKDAEGRTSKLHGVNQDITERKQAEAELQQEKALSDAIINGLPGVFYLFDVEGKLVRWNKQYETVLGYTTEETAARNAIDPIADEHKERTFAAIQLAFTEGQGNVEADLVTKSGQRIPYYFVGQRLQLGNQLYLAGAGIDITERKQLQAQIQEAFERRGLQVQLSTQVSQSIAAASSLEELYERVVTQVKEQFGYYHTQLLRYDPTQEAVMLVTGYGEIGAKMLAAGHRLPMGEGLIGTAAATGETVLRPSLENDPDWQPNPLLRETKGEIAVPIKLGDTILGVLDVQSNVAGTLDADDQLLLEGLCGQIATAIDSTRLRQEMTERLEEINRLYRAMSHEGWQTYKETTGIPSSFMFDQGVIKPVHKDGLIEELFAQVPLTVPGGEAIGTLAIADDPQRPISPDDQTFVEQVAEQVALALESARLFEQTQTALTSVQESQSALNEAMAVASMANWTLNLETFTFTFNDRLYQMLGTTVEEEGGYELSAAEYTQKYIHPEDAGLIAEAIQTGLQNPDAQNFKGSLEYRMIRKDGQLRYMLTDYRLIVNEQGKVVSGVGSFLDITERKLAELAVTKRAAELATVAEVGTTTSTTLEPDRLLQAVVDLTKERFGLYHTHIYLVSPDEKTLILTAGAGEVGQQMLAEGWSIPVDHELSIIAEAYRGHKSVVANDVYHDQDSTFLSNRLLPGTRSEMALPLIVGDKVLGVFDVQSEKVGYFAEEDINIYTTLASQVAVTLQNARLFDQIQTALMESEGAQKLTRNVIDSTDDWIFVKDREHRYQLVNQGYARALHIPVEAFIGKTDLDLGFPEELVKGNPEKGIRGFWTDDQLVMDTGMPQHFPDDPATIDGKIRIFDTIKVPLRDASGTIWGVLAFSRDLTERKQDEQIIAQRALQLETVAAVSTTASTVLDPDQLLQAVVDLTKEKFDLYHVHIYLSNESWDTLLLASGAGEVGRKLVAEQHAIPISLEQSLVARAARERKPVIVNNVDSEPGFLPNPLLTETRAEMAVPMMVGDRLLGVFDVQSKDEAGFSEEDANIYVTLATQVGVALQNARLYVEQAATLTQLRELDKLKSSFLANMSHELRTPLNSILGFTDVIMEGLDGPLTEHMDADLRLIQKNGQHLLHLINDVLDMAKIEAGRMNLNPETFKAFEVLEEVTSITSTLASEKNLALFIDEQTDRDIKIYADRTRLRQVMINLVNNSIKFTDQGEVVLKVLPMDGARVLISVRDTGLGIPPEKLEAIFQEFTQVDSSTTRKTGGTGLGLPISRRLVEMHGGRLWAQSNGISGEGSIFFVELPIEARITEVVEKQEK